MKLSKITLCLASAAFMLSANAFAAGDNTSGSLHATGQILDATCTIDSNQLNQSISLGNIPVSAVTVVSPGAVVAQQDINFTFTNCPTSLTGLGVRFNYTADPAGNYLPNTGDAEGVLVGISSTHDNTALASGAVVNSEDYDASNGGDATVHAKANVYRVDSSVPTGGSIDSISQIVIVYN
ncbi:fimbrial protein [Trabulsiella odontotermitis]|uniref:Fimbrial-type adhesion domain-containing protein n=1 Tax=Trabulsiella odontotermitis TaxID=379893 RepID=A0A0L0GSG4_9ENTR|nr:fimbrial protein [Trabulsiella odontotermitis]KNC91789.1 hypothetical protein GM31_01360 [Trabulsiella odontotermitis]